MATQRRPYEVIAERIIELLIKLCGISAIVFVFSIFFFVFREGAPFLAKLGFAGFFKDFVFSTEWFPTSQTNTKFGVLALDRKSTRLNSSHLGISYAVFCLKKKHMRN